MSWPGMVLVRARTLRDLQVLQPALLDEVEPAMDVDGRALGPRAGDGVGPEHVRDLRLDVRFDDGAQRVVRRLRAEVERHDELLERREPPVERRERRGVTGRGGATDRSRGVVRVEL